MKKVFILNGGISEIPIIEECKKMGLFTITGGNAPGLPGHQISDQYICCDYSNEEEILDIVKRENIDFIISSANDFGLITASYVAEKMGWKGHDTYENTVLLHQKDLFKDYIMKLGVPTPETIFFEDIETAKKYVSDCKYPIIVKSVDLTGGKGINKAMNLEEALSAIDIAFNMSRAKRIVIEPYITGTQHSCCVFLKNHKVIASVSCNSYSPINPYLIQTEVFPADDFDTVKNIIHSNIEKISTDLNLVDGVFTVQFIRQGNEVYIIEAMRRCLGNQFFTPATDLTGFPWIKALICSECGMSLDNLHCEEPKYKNVGFHGIMTTKNGVIEKVNISSVLTNHLTKMVTLMLPGDEITNCLNERAGYIYFQYENREEMLKEVKKFNEYMTIDVKENNL